MTPELESAPTGLGARTRGFDDGRTSWSVLQRACREARLDGKGARLLRLGENAIYALASAPVIVRIARSADYLSDVRKELSVARWLASAGYPGARLVNVEQPLVLDGRVVTFWDFIESGEERPTMADLGRLLRTLHGLGEPTGVRLPILNPFARVERRLANAPASVKPATVDFLRQRTHSLKGQYGDLDFVLPQGPIHGDAHTGNLLRDTMGIVWLLDFEAFARGPREWDLSVAAGHFEGFGWVSHEQYQSFADAYGYDVLLWPGFKVVRAVRELTMTTWLMQNVEERVEVAEEFARRIGDLHDDEAPRRWTPM
jgi:Ser/Thr protein kinase RdoA (MazF antagonist)